MISDKGKQFLTQFIFNNNIDEQIKSLAYSERITIALDLQILIKHLVKELEVQTGEDVFGLMFTDGSDG